MNSNKRTSAASHDYQIISNPTGDKDGDDDHGEDDAMTVMMIMVMMVMCHRTRLDNDIVLDDVDNNDNDRQHRQQCFSCCLAYRDLHWLMVQPIK